jgi:hypothetical protein
MSAGTVPTSNNLTVTVEKKAHKKAHVYVQKSVSFGKTI